MILGADASLWLGARAAISLMDIQGLELDAVPSRCLGLQILLFLLLLMVLILLALLLLWKHRECLRHLCDGSTVDLGMRSMLHVLLALQPRNDR